MTLSKIPVSILGLWEHLDDMEVIYGNEKGSGQRRLLAYY